jgi:hypothetical protein
VWPFNGLLSGAPLSVSHKRTVLSSEPETICFPSEEKATDLTRPVWPFNGSPSGAPLSAFHKRTVLSSEPEIICFPSGEKVTDLTEPTVAFEWLA